MLARNVLCLLPQGRLFPSVCCAELSNANGKTIGKFPTEGYLINAFWRSDNKYVAVNNRRANAGDYLWVLNLSSSQAVKMPDDSDKAADAVIDQIAKKFPEVRSFSYDFLKMWTKALGWNSAGELIAQTKLTFDKVNELYVIVDTYKIDKEQLVLLRSTIETTKLD